MDSGNYSSLVASDLPMEQLEAIVAGFGVLACFKDLGCGDIRAGMTFLAGVGLSSHFHRKLVAAVTGGTGPLASIRIDSANPLVWPTGKYWKIHASHLSLACPCSGNLHFRPVAVEARIRIRQSAIVFGRSTGFRGRHGIYGLGQELIEAVIHQVPVSPGHQIALVLLRLDRMAGTAVFRTDHDMHFVAVVFEGIPMRFWIESMALGATNSKIFHFLGNIPKGDFSIQALLPGCFRRGDFGMPALFPG